MRLEMRREIHGARDAHPLCDMPQETETARCDREIARCLAYLSEGGPEDIGAYVGLTDWQEERRLIVEQCYASFLAKKRKVHNPTGFNAISLGCEALYPFQKHIVRWALKLGRAAIFADCGLGKTLMQLEWARQVHHQTGKPVLILAPLAVSKQTQREGERFGYAVTIARHQSDVCGVSITNYEMLDHFQGSAFGGVVLDESSILKSYSGATRNAIIEAFGATPFRLACTATPSPNDYMELGNHSEFLGAMSRAGMLATFFNHDGGETSKWRIKGHAEKAFWRWVSSWAVMIARPSDIGYSDMGFTLPELRRHYHSVETEAQDGFLFAVEASSLSERRESRKISIEERVAQCLKLIADGNLNTPPQEKQSTPQALKNANGASHKVGHQNGTLNTCEPITPTISNGQKTTSASTRKRKTRDDVSATLRSRDTNSLPLMVSRSGPHLAGSETPCSNPSSEFPLTNTLPSLNGNSEGAPSAVSHRPIVEATSCTLTTATQPARSAGYSAGTATLESESSEIVPDSLSSPPNTWANHRPWVIWCELNAEQEALEKAFGDAALSVHGALSMEEKERRIFAWLGRERPILITKPKVAGWGLNMQFCNAMVFMALSDSYESTYQAERRCWRYGQKRPVDIHVLMTDRDAAIVRNIERKRKQAEEMTEQMVQAVKEAHEE